MNGKMNPALYTVLSAVLISIFALRSVDGDEEVRFPNIMNWWDRDWVTRKPRTEQFISAAYYYPYLCSIIFYNDERMRSGLLVGEWASACTIFTQHWVIFSIDNLDRPCDNHNSRYNTIRYHFTIYHRDLKVVHGSVYGSPSTEYRNNMIKKHTIDRLYYRAALDPPVSLIVKNEDDYSDGKWNISNSFERNQLGGAAAGAAFARIESPGFSWDPFTLSAPMIAPDPDRIKRRVEEHIKFLEEQTSSQKSCYVGAYHRFNKKMKWFQVMYIPQDECREVYCTYNPAACLEFPNKDLHVCFKSLVYGDLCPEDRGAAVYCPDFGHSIFGILTVAPNCGWKNLPNVYTRIDFLAKVYTYNAMENVPRDRWRTFRYPDDLKVYTILPPGHITY